MSKTNRTIYDCIGDNFERVLEEQFPELSRPEKERVSPDFLHPGFLLEAKCGYWEYGVQLKSYQVNNFHKIKEKPVIYIIGFHSLNKTKTLLRGMSPEEMDIFLRDNMGFHSAYLVSDKIIRKLWKKEAHLAKSNSNWEYFSLKPRHLDNIIFNRNFRRLNTLHTPFQHYGIRRSGLLLQPAPPLNDRMINLEFGLILDINSDGAAINYFTNTRPQKNL